MLTAAAVGGIGRHLKLLLLLLLGADTDDWLSTLSPIDCRLNRSLVACISWDRLCSDRRQRLARTDRLLLLP
jgi:hypothetical protein